MLARIPAKGFSVWDGACSLALFAFVYPRLPSAWLTGPTTLVGLGVLAVFVWHAEQDRRSLCGCIAAMLLLMAAVVGASLARHAAQAPPALPAFVALLQRVVMAGAASAAGRPLFGWAPRRWVLAPLLGMLAVLSVAPSPVSEATVAHRRALAALGPVPDNAPAAVAAATRLEALARAGWQQAAWASVALAAAQAPPAAALWQRCPRSRSWQQAKRSLPPTWDARVSQGHALCAALAAFPEQGAAVLAAQTDFGASLLHARLLFQAGAVTPALARLGSLAARPGLLGAQARHVAAAQLTQRHRHDDGRGCAAAPDTTQWNEDRFDFAQLGATAPEGRNPDARAWHDRQDAEIGRRVLSPRRVPSALVLPPLPPLAGTLRLLIRPMSAVSVLGLASSPCVLPAATHVQLWTLDLPPRGTSEPLVIAGAFELAAAVVALP